MNRARRRDGWWRPANPQRAFSLVELLVAMALGLLLAGAAAGVTLSVRQVSWEQDRVASLKENLRFASEFMIRDIRPAGLLATGGLDLAAGLEPGDPDQAVQQVFTVRKAGMNCLGQTGTWVASVYSVANGQLRCGNDAVPPQVQPLVDHVQSMTAVALNADGAPDWNRPVALRVELVLRSPEGAPETPYRLEFVAGLRNAVLEQYSFD
ncbi:hypothetical protein TVNIR_0386 [Thioalkalivibrio nitratireducens DSM 14787]|uniref:Prepilin-type N-terminal cleavage/methylation domain-containing protein n=1 Tax=Thioalkalivibrio nitratireducens (strain DSM 14787 / UNIQEM 213 / ALEN2) TaxID=1255043 RepID=L0DR78_THIND|nr:prepilin-type N-terminal cleavage/methylation domain-containing protein [Thioalkalivibrio nitratireducens]AGA32094.1 hypothetical protein TVNIR_0386 [Thioalkalivibrio nitratireducens DSM 14787]